MDKLIYLIYPLLAVILLFGAKLSKKNEWNEGAFSLEQTKALQGFCAISIMLHHIGQKTCASWLAPRLIMPGLELFVPIGYFLVGVFLFCSGYGLYKSIKAKENYLKGFVVRRILPLILSYYITGLVFLAVRFLIGEKMTPLQIFYYVSGMKLCNPNAWYVIALPIFYFGFLLAFRLFKSEKASITFITVFVFAYILLGTCIDHNSFWMRGEWWYNSAHMFLIGLYFAKYEKGVIAHIKRHYPLYLVLFFFGTYALFQFSNYTQGRFSYYGENWGAPDKIQRRWICLFSQQMACLFFIASAFTAMLKLQIGNAFLKFMGSITLEFYLIHGLFLELLAYNFDGGAKSLYYLRNVPLLVVIVFVCAVPSALLLQKLLQLCLKGVKKSL